MRRPLRLLVHVLVATTLVGCGSGSPAVPGATPSVTAETASPEPSSSSAPGRTRITINGNEALRWGDGRYGVVLAHGSSYDAASWSTQAPRIAAQGATVVAVEDIGPDAIQEAVAYLRSRGVAEVALMGGSAGADAILQLASQEPNIADQLVLLSPNQVVSGLGPEPKLIIASAGEPRVGVARELASGSPGTRNTVKIVPGRAHAQQILERDDGGPLLRLVLERLRG